MITKYKQKLTGYRLLTYPTELNQYYNIHKFSCLKILAKGTITKILTSEFSTYSEIKKPHLNGAEQKKKEMLMRLKNQNAEAILKSVTFEDLIDYDWLIPDPFSMSSIAINLRFQYQLKSHCSVCGFEPSTGNASKCTTSSKLRKEQLAGSVKL
jgi:hypothetical protein